MVGPAPMALLVDEATGERYPQTVVENSGWRVEK